MVARQSGFTLVELMVTIVIIGILAVVGVSFSNSWTDEAAITDAKSQLSRAFGQAKAVSMRNPTGATSDSAVAASVSLSGGVLLVCEGPANGAGCVAGGAAVVSQSTWPNGVTANIAQISINNRGQVLSNGNPINTGLTFTLSKGGVTDDSGYNQLR